MTLDEMEMLFEKHEDQYLVKPNGDPRRDIDAFNAIDKLCPSNGDMISCAEHDEFWLSVEPEKLASLAEEETIIFLIQCGVRYDNDTQSFAFFA